MLILTNQIFPVVLQFSWFHLDLALSIIVMTSYFAIITKILSSAVYQLSKVLSQHHELFQEHRTAKLMEICCLASEQSVHNFWF